MVAALCLMLGGEDGWFAGGDESDEGNSRAADFLEARSARNSRARKPVSSLSEKQICARLAAIAEKADRQYAKANAAVTDRSSIDHILNNPLRVSIKLWLEEKAEVKELVSRLSVEKQRELFKLYFRFNNKGEADVLVPTMVGYMADMLLERIASKNAGDTVAWLFNEGYDMKNRRLRVRVALGWAENEPREALSFWLDELPQGERPWWTPGSPGGFEIFQRIGGVDYQAGMEMVRERPIEQRFSSMNGLISGLPVNANYNKVVDLLGVLPWMGKASLAEDELCEHQRITINLASQWALSEPEKALEWYEGFDVFEKNLDEYTSAESHFDGRRMTIMYSWASKSPENMLAWAKSQNYELRKRAARALGQSHPRKAFAIALNEPDAERRFELATHATKPATTLLDNQPNIGNLFSGYRLERVSELTQAINESDFSTDEKTRLIKWLKEQK